MATDDFAKRDQHIIFFDGVCNLCNGFIDFVIRHDQQARFLFAPLQGATAKKLLPPAQQTPENQDPDSVILFSPKTGRIALRSTAALDVLAQLDLPYSILGKALSIFPITFRDFVYRQIAKCRYKIFGRKETCRIPTAAERQRFLD